MILKDYINNFSDKEVVGRITELYSDEDAESYLIILEHLRTLKPVMSDLSIHIVELEDDGEKHHHVFGTVVKDEIDYSLGWTHWEEWLGMSIGEETLKNYSHLDILVHCLWDMTFYGWSREEIEKVIDQCTDAKDEYETFNTMEEFIDNLDRKE